MRLTFCLTICLVQIVLNVAADKGTYTVIAPGRIYPNEIYTAVVSVQHIDGPCKINVSISGPSYKERKQIVVSQYQVALVDFDVPHLEGSNYNLTAESVDCMDKFKNTTKLDVYKNKYEVIIQTDRGLYRPGDAINYRVLFMDKDLRPVEHIKNSIISLSDGQKNKVKEIHDFKTSMGVITGRFTIPERSAAGEWSLSVLQGSEFVRTAHFTVEDKFVVKLDATEEVSIYDGDLNVLVTANHICGEPVNGEVSIEISLNVLERFYINPPKNISTTAKMVNGIAQIYLNLKKHYLLYTHNYRSGMKIVARVKEDRTNVTVTETLDRHIHFYRYILTCSRLSDEHNDKSCFSFEGGKENLMLFQIRHINGSLVKAARSPIELTFKEVLGRDFRYGLTPAEHPISENKVLQFNGILNATGFVRCNAVLGDLPQYEGYDHYYELSYKYMEEERAVFYTHAKRKPTKYFTLEDQSDKKLVFRRASPFTIKSSEPLSYFHYIVIGNRNIMEAGRIELSNKPKVYDLMIRPQRRWGNKFRVYVYYVDDNGEYHYDEKRYQVYVTPNPVIIEHSAFLMPGENATITIQTNPKSFVGLVAVDQRMLLMKRNNDVTASQLDEILNNFATFTPSQGGYSRYPGAIAGCVTLTNADYFYSRKSVPQKPSIGIDGEGVFRHENKQTVAMPPRLGQNMCKTLSFENFGSPPNGEIVFTTPVPDIKTTLVFTAFSVNAVNGFSASEQATEITVFK